MTQRWLVAGAILMIASRVPASCAQANPKLLTAQIEDLGGWQPHGKLNDIQRLWVLPSGQIAYTLYSPYLSLKSSWSRYGKLGATQDIVPGGIYTSVEITGMNSHGVIIGQAYRSIDSRDRAFVIDGGTRTDLHGVDRNDHETRAIGINDSGVIIGQMRSTGGAWRPCKWIGTRCRPLGPINGKLAQPVAINNRGQILFAHVTMSYPSRVEYHLVTDGRARRISTLDWDVIGLGALNDHGEIAGGAARTSTPMMAIARKVVLLKNGQLKDLGQIGDLQMSVMAMSNDGLIVGTTFSGPSNVLGGGAYIYHPVSGFRTLDSLLPAGSGWKLTTAQGVDDNGRIFGIGELRGQPRIFRLTINNK